MTLDSKHSKDVYQGNGSTTAFPFAFKVWNTSQITVTVTDAAGVSTDVTSNSTVTLTSSGGSVTYPNTGTPLPTGAKLAIVRNMPFTQGINLTTASRFDPQVLEDGLDQATAERQQMLEQMARAVILPATSSDSPEDVVASIYASRDAAAVSANAASAQATAAQASATAAANIADTAEQTVQTAAADAVAAATAQAEAAANSADAAAASAAAAEAASGGLAGRMDAVEEKNTQQDARLDDIEDINAQQSIDISTIASDLTGKANSDFSNTTNNAIKYYFHACDIKPQGTNGGSTSAGAWMTRDVNTILINRIGASLSGNKITLQPGTYLIRAAVPAFGIDFFKAAIYDSTNAQYKIFGTSGCAGSGDSTTGHSFINDELVITAPTQIEIRMYALGTIPNGCGRATSAQVEKYTEVLIWKVQ